MRGRGARGREAGVRGEGSGVWGPPCPPPHKEYTGVIKFRQHKHIGFCSC